MKTYVQKSSLLFLLFVSTAVGLASVATAGAKVIVHEVDLINGGFDVNGDGLVGPADHLTGLVLFFDDAAPIRADIISGMLDLDEDGLLGEADDAISNVDLTVADALGFMKSVQVNVILGQVDVDGGGIGTSDDLSNVQLVEISGLPAMNKVDVIDGLVDVNQDGSINGLDYATNLLWAFNDAALIMVNIINGRVDCNQDGFVGALDTLPNADLAQSKVGGQHSNQVSIIFAGQVDVDLDGDTDSSDDLNDVRLVDLDLTSTKHRVDIRDGKVDVDQNGLINAADDLADVLLLFNDAAPIVVDIIDGMVDVNQSGAIGFRDDLSNVDFNGVTAARVNNQADIIDGLIDVNEDGAITAADDATNVDLITP